MKIVKSFSGMKNDWMMDYTKDDGLMHLRKIEYCARVSHRSEDKITINSYDRFLRFVVLEKGDWSVVEHASVTVEALVDRGITHEWVRHRLGSYTQESTRFVNYNKLDDISFIDMKDQLSNGTRLIEEVNIAIVESQLEQIEKTYNELIERKVSPQLARSVLPNALASKIIVTYNLRQWRHFFLMRTTKETHPQFREVTIPLLKEFKEKIPILYEDIEPEAKQSENMKRMH